MIYNAADATAAQAYTGITGSLVMGVGFAGVVDLPRLRTVGGDVFAEGGGLTNLRAPNLTSIGNDLWIYLVTALVEVDLRSLVTVGGRLWVYRNPKLATLRLDALRQVAEDVEIRDDSPLGACVVDDIVSHITAGMTIVGLGTPHPMPLRDRLQPRGRALSVTASTATLAGTDTFLVCETQTQ